MSQGQLIEFHALCGSIHAQRRLEELLIAHAPHLKEDGRRRIFRMFETQSTVEDPGDQTESEMPLSAEDFERMRKENI